MMSQCFINILVIKYSHTSCEDDRFYILLLLTCYEIFCFSIKSNVDCELVVVDMFLECLRADCFTHTSMFSGDGRMLSCFCQNTRVLRYVYLTLMNDFKSLHITKLKPYSVVCNVCGSCYDIFKVPKVVVLIIFNHC
jgi:hypothetical protein